MRDIEECDNWIKEFANKEVIVKASEFPFSFAYAVRAREREKMKERNAATQQSNFSLAYARCFHSIKT